MSNSSARIQNLSPNRRKLLELRQARRVLKTYPLSYAQQRLWFLDQLETESTAYNIPIVLKLEGELNKDAWRRTLDELVRRHEILRTSFVMHGDQPVQQVAPEGRVDCTETDLTGYQLEDQQREIQRVISADAGAPFDLRQAPLLRMRLLKLGEQQYALVLIMHHIITDGWSFAITEREFRALYEAYANGLTQSPLPPLPIQYGDFSVWQREWLQGPLMERQLGYWKKQLANLPVLELPTDYPRPPVVSHRGRTLRFQSGKELSERLRRLSEREDATLYMTVLACFQLLLGKYSGQKDIPVGTAIANRNRVETEGLIGFFVNTLVIRTDLNPDYRLRELLRQVRHTVVTASEHQDVPFEKLVEELRPERNLSRSPLFQVMFVWLNVSGRELEAAGLSASTIEMDPRTAKFDLSLLAINNPAGLHYEISYATDLYEQETIEQFMRDLQHLLNAVVSDAEQRIADICLMTQTERQQLLVDWNQTGTEMRQKYVHELFEEQVLQAPSAVAVEFERQQLSYAELNHKANQLAHYLLSLGLQTESLVGVCMYRSLEMVISLLGILKAGGAYVPFDPDYPAERLAYMAANSGIRALLTTSDFEELLPSSGTVVNLQKAEKQIEAENCTNPEVRLVPDNLAYVIYTSGSTGRPKGAMNSHAGISNRLQWMQREYEIGPQDRVLQKTPFSFDVSVWEFFLPLIAGSRLVVAAPGGHKDPAYLERIIQEGGITTVHFVPSMLQAFLNAKPADSNTRIKKLICSGEALGAAIARECLATFADEVHNLYGPTEAAVDVTYWNCAATELERNRVAIGRPVANTTVYVVDEEMHPVPVGVAGELCLGGIQLGRGYVNQPALTAERFIPDPFSENPGQRLYRTGDLVRWQRDGNLDYLGRLDHQVKLRGFRIEPGEIESTLSSFAGVEQAVVSLYGASEHQVLVAYVVSKDRAAGVEINSLREYLKKKLPEYMVPAAFVVMETLPLLPNGKVDRKSLPTPQEQDRRQFTEPRNAQEEILCGIFADVMKLDHIGIDDNFFELGGHSLLATQVISRVRNMLKIDLPVRMLFECPTVAGLAAAIEGRRTSETAGMPPLSNVSRDAQLPLSYAQQRLWFIEQLDPGNTAYNMAVGLHLTGVLDREVLQRSMNEIVRRHEVLRTSFPAHDGTPLQKIAPTLTLPMPEVELSHLTPAAREEAARSHAVAERTTPFDLAAGPLLRVKLLRLAKQEHVLLVTMHHIVSDGWSLGIIVREFSRLYSAFIKGEEQPLTELKIQYADFAVWQQDWLKGEVLKEQLAYWRSRLEGVEALELPTDRVRKALRENQGGEIAIEIAPEDNIKIREVARSQGATVFMVLLSALDVLLWRYSGQTGVTVGTAIANRNYAAIEDLIGFFVNTLVLRAEVQAGMSGKELLNSVRHTALEAYRHQDVPFERLVEELQPERDLSRPPLFQVALVLQNFPEREFSLPGLTVTAFREGESAAKSDIALVIQDQGKDLKGTIHYAAGLFERETIAGFAAHWKELVRNFVANPSRPLHQLTFLSEKEHQQVLQMGNGAGERDFWRGGIANEFAEQVKRTPGNPAVIWNGGHLAYQELAARVWRMARYLRGLGVGTDDRVVVCLGPGWEVIVTMLGAAAAGAAYVPVDPEYPADRLAAIVADTSPAAVVTESRLRGKFLQSAAQVIYLDLEQERISEQDAAPLQMEVNPENLLYIIYTSGSTGRPKGVAIPQAAMLGRVTYLLERYQSRSQDRHLLILSPSFDAFGGGLYAALFSGGAVVFPERDDMLEPAGLLSILQQQQIANLRLPVGNLQQLLGYASRNGVSLPNSLRLIVTGGETLSRADIRVSLERCAPGTRIIHEYGPTETTITATLTEITSSGQSHHLHRPLIGKPHANTRVYVLQEDMTPAAIGTVGELYIGGVGLARAYIGQADWTAEKFVPNPFSERGGERLYRTGDWSRWLPDGNLEFVGRRDGQVKIRGYRIELGEIESVLNSVEGVKQAVVILREDAPGMKRLVGYVVPMHEGSAPSAAELRKHLQQKLPQYMVPAILMELPELPLVAGGKLDRKRLPEPASNPAESELLPPRSVEEEILCGLWCELLKRDRVGIDENFFDLGGHSLLATQLIARVRSTFNVEVPLRALFESPTVKALAKQIEEQRQKSTGHEVPPITTADRTAPLPLSFAQQRLWFLSQLHPESVAYNIPLALRLKGNARTDLIEKAFNEVVRRHETLRTRFTAIEGEAHQVIEPEVVFSLPLLDLGTFPTEEREAEIHKEIHREARRPFNLERGPLVRAQILRAGEDEHVFLLVIHHIVSDGWSMQIMVGEFSRLYRAYIKDEETPLQEIKIQYADFAAWQRSWLQGAVMAHQLQYWRTQLEDVPPLELSPGFVPESENGETISRDLPKELGQKLKEVGRREGTTLFMTLLAAFQYLLARYSGQHDIAVGTPIAGRRWTEIENTVGFFANTLVLRTKISAGESIRDLLKDVRKTTLEAYRHQDIPFEKLVEELQPERNLVRTPLFQAMFILQNLPVAELQLPDLKLSEIRSKSKMAKFDLTMAASEHNGVIHAVLIYRTGLFTRDKASLLMQHWENLLHGMALDPEIHAAEIPMLTQQESAQVLEEWNRTETAYPAVCVHELFERQAALTPLAIAAEFGERQLTYEELNQHANRLARYLRKRGVTTDDRIGICVSRSFDMIVSVLAVLKAGAAYVPLDSKYPSTRLAYMLENSHGRLVITQESFRELFGEHPGFTLYLDGTELFSVKEEDAANPNIEVTPENLVYVIYTSGSTGKPKGVAMAHGALANLIHSQISSPSSYRALRCLQFSSFSFDVSFQEMFTTWCSGGTFVLTDEDVRFDPRALWQAIREHKVERLFMPFVALQQMAEAAESENELGCLRQIITAGEQLKTTPALVKLFSRLSGCRLENHYGPAETHVVTTHLLPEDPSQWTPLPPIGKGIPNSKLYVLSDGYSPVPQGVPGELYLGGRALSRGYLNRPDWTAERYVPDPFSRQPGSRLYCTGDLVRFMENGELEFLGRKDHQVKIRGFRIELAEIETALNGCEGVAQSAVIVSEIKAGEKRLLAYIIAKSGCALDAQQIRSQLKTSLPEYMIPSVLTEMQKFPLTPSGKVDRKQLPSPTDTGAGFEHAPPQTLEEEILYGIWKEVLKRERVGVEDNFFDLGGHSLLATQVMARLRNALKVDLPVRALFDSPTIRGLAKRVAQHADKTSTLELSPITHIERHGPLPLSFAQQRLWFLDQFDPESAVYNLPFAIKMEGALDLGVVERAWNEIVRRHEVLRTRFEVFEGEPQQVILPAGRVSLPVTDLSMLAGRDRERRVREFAQEETQKPFDLEHGPLLRAQALRLQEQTHVLLVTMHHIVSDGWSIGILAREFTALYGAYIKGEPSPLPELKVQYGDFAVWQRGWLQGELLREQLGYWRNQLENVASLDLPTDYPRSRVHDRAAHVLPWELPESLSQKLARFSQREGATLYMTLLAGFQLLLSRYSSQTDIAVGTPIAGRRWTEIEGLVGFFINTLVLRANLSGTPTFRELVRHVRDITLDAYRHQDLPFEKLVEEVHQERDLSRSPLFQVMFVWQNALRGQIELPGLKIELMELDPESVKFDLRLGAAEVEGKIQGTLIYCASLFSQKRMSAFLQHWQTLLTEVVLDPNRQVSQLNMLTVQERRQLLEDWNGASAEVPQDRCIHELFEEQVKQTPANVAVECEGKQLTFAELDRFANQLARHLIRLGVGPEVRVGLGLQRSMEMVIGIMAIFKAGGAYVPLDPSYPAERLQYMVEDAGIAVLLSRELFLPQFQAFTGAMVNLDVQQDEIRRLSAEKLESKTHPENLAYVLYTSGSTGHPKGVTIEHRQLINYVYAVMQRISRPCNFAMVQPLTVDSSVTALYPPLLSGKCVYMVSREQSLDAAGMNEYFRQHDVEGLKIAPSHLAALHASTPDEWCMPSRTLIIGGESSNLEWVRRLQEMFPECDVMNHYGPTEATVGVLTYAIKTGNVTSEHGNAPLGKPLANTQIYILDNSMAPVPVGVAGEIFIGGDNVARGYLNRPEMTAEKFVPDPFQKHAEGRRLYRTGDRARYLETGDIEFLGRFDDQVKYRGFRIELEEIERAVLGSAQAREALVMLRNDMGEHQRLVAYIVPAMNGLDVRDVREHLRKRLPEYMVPHDFVELEALPRTPHGKLDRKRLPRPAQLSAEQEYVPPRDAEEHILSEIFAQVLKLDRVGANDNFFDHGGHSLLATQVISRVRSKFSVEMPLRALFECPSVAGMAERVRKASVLSSMPHIEIPLETKLAELENLSEEEAERLLEILEQSAE